MQNNVILFTKKKRNKMNKKSYNPVYKSLADKLCDKIAAEKLADGDFFCTIKDISCQYNIAVLTARRAVNVLLNNGIIECKSACGIFVKSTAALETLRARKNFILIINDHSDGSIMASYWAMRLCSILQVLSNSGFSVKITNSAEITEKDLFSMQELLSGIIISASRAKKYQNFFDSKSAPPVIFTRKPEFDFKSEKISFPIYDDKKLFYSCCEYFIRNNKKKIIIANFNDSYFPQQYIADFKDKLNFSEVRTDLLPSVEAGINIAQNIKLDKESAIWAQDDFTAIGIYNFFLANNCDLFADKALLATAGPTVSMTEQLKLPVIGFCPWQSGKLIAENLINIINGQTPQKFIISPSNNKNV